MAYNPFKLWSKGVGRKKRLPSNSPLLLRIQNGDFEYSPYFYEAQIAQQDADRIYKEVYDRRSKFSHDVKAIEADAGDADELQLAVSQPPEQVEGREPSIQPDLQRVEDEARHHQELHQ